MRISGTEPSSVILSQTMAFKKLESDNLKVQMIIYMYYKPVIIFSQLLASKKKEKETFQKHH